MNDSALRSLAKTVSWRITGSGATFAISYMVLGNFVIAGSIAIAQLISNTILYFVHERLWNKIKWGKNNGTNRNN